LRLHEEEALTLRSRLKAGVSKGEGERVAILRDATLRVAPQDEVRQRHFAGGFSSMPLM
jgi:hypothetical protein